MLALLLSMVVLGLSAVDPIGIGLVLLLLTQQKPYARSLVFLAGSFCALIFISFLFAEGLGAIVLRTENAHHWLAPTFQIVAGILLIMFAAVSLAQKDKSELGGSSQNFRKYVKSNNFVLFSFGFVLVVAQSIIDVVFLVAMTHVARLHLSRPRLIAAVLLYTAAALSIQIAIVIAYAGTPPKRRQRIIDCSNNLLEQYGQKATVGIGMLLGVALCLNGLLTALSKPHF